MGVLGGLCCTGTLALPLADISPCVIPGQDRAEPCLADCPGPGCVRVWLQGGWGSLVALLLQLQDWCFLLVKKRRRSLSG